MIEKLIEFYKLLNTPAELPLPWGVYHILCIVMTVAVAAILIRLFADADEKAVRILAFIFWIIILVLEILKQLQYVLHLVNGEFIWKYSWGALPYQFCSMPLYIMPLVIFLKDGRTRDYSIVFLATFAIVGGIALFLTPETVFTENMFLNIQTMVHHGTQIFFGAYLAFRYREKLNMSKFFGATGLCLLLAFIALFLNVAGHELLPMIGGDQSFNLFFISPYKRDIPSALKGLGIEALPYGVFLAGLISIMFALAFLVMCAMKGLSKLLRYD
jgi:hypothetical protein